MPPTTKIQELEELLMTMGQGHHEAFAATDGVDPEWPLWYAEHMVDRANVILEVQLTQSDLVYLLVWLSREHPRVAPGSRWSAFYAKTLAQRYGLD